MYEIVSVDPILNKIGLSNDIVQNIVAESVFSGLPYVEVCRKCSEYYVCILTKVLPIDVDQYVVYVSGLLVFVDKDKPLDKTIEDLMSKASIVKYYCGKVSFYIPANYVIYTYNKLCEREESGEFVTKAIDNEEILIHLGEDIDNS